MDEYNTPINITKDQLHEVMPRNYNERWTLS
jgi:hypothetical protein